MTTISDFGSLEVKQLRIQNDISAVRYGTEIMDKDLIFKVGDISNPNQSIRFAVHNGESYKEAFAVDSNGFAVSNLNMTGPSTGITGIDELVKLGEIRLQHFDDHENEKAGEISFSVNVGDNNSRTVDILSLSPDEVEITTAAKVHGVLSCSDLATMTAAIRGNEFRTVIASFSHPLASNVLRVERDESGDVVLSGILNSEKSAVRVLENETLHSEVVLVECCSAGAIFVDKWQIANQGYDLSIRGHGRLRTDDFVAYSAEATTVVSEEIDCDSLSTSRLCCNSAVCSALSTGRLHFGTIECNEHLDLPHVSSLTIGGVRVDEHSLALGTHTLLS